MEVFIPTIDEVKKAYARKGYKLYDKELSANIYAVRNDEDNYTNDFSDTLGILYKEKNEWKQIQIPATTKPGLGGKRGVLNPRPQGVAVLVPNQYLRCWQWHDTYAEFTKYPFMRQVGVFQLYRDRTRDTVIDKDVIQDNAIETGINLHRMSAVGYRDGVLDEWSEGCQGAEEPEYKKLLPIIRASAKTYGNIFSYTLFEKKDFF